jgi:NADH dehydrogenase
MSISGATGVIGNRLIDLYYSFTNQNFEKKKDIVVVGYGWAGKSFYEHIDKKKYNVHVVNKHNYMLNTTKLKRSLYSHDSHLILPSEQIPINNKIIGTIENIDLNNKKIVTSDKNSLYYDYLVLAVGSVVNDFGIEGVKEYCNFLKDENDLIKLRQDLMIKKRYYTNESPIRIEQSVGILGAGPAGIELAFEIANLKKEVYIIEAMDKILPMFSEDAANIVKKELEDAGIKLHLNNKVSKITKNEIQTNEKNYYFDVAIWNCGIKPNSLISLITNDGRINAYDNFKVHNLKGQLNLDQSHVYAIGDIVASKTHGPPTAQNAVQQGKYLAKYFNNNLKGDEGYKFNELGKIIYTKNYLVLDSKYGVYKIPKMLSPIVELFIA